MTSATLAVVAWSVFAVGAVGRPETRWLAAANPVVVTLAIALATAPSDLLRSFVGAAAPNLAHAIYFLAAGFTGGVPTTAGWRADGGPART